MGSAAPLYHKFFAESDSKRILRMNHHFTKSEPKIKWHRFFFRTRCISRNINSCTVTRITQEYGNHLQINYKQYTFNIQTANLN